MKSIVDLEKFKAHIREKYNYEDKSPFMHGFIEGMLQNLEQEFFQEEYEEPYEKRSTEQFRFDASPWVSRAVRAASISTTTSATAQDSIDGSLTIGNAGLDRLLKYEMTRTPGEHKKHPGMQKQISEAIRNAVKVLSGGK
jgi:hypothetical protein